jgi:hypothetical protein
MAARVVRTKYLGDNYYRFYIRFKDFLEFIQDEVLYKIKASGTTPIFRIDTDEESNLMYIEDLQVSVDPEICLVSRPINIDGFSYNFIGSDLTLGTPASFESSIMKGRHCYGKIMNIYVNMRWVLMKLNELKDNENLVVFIEFLNSLLNDICRALGGVNALETIIDEVTNYIKIIDKNPLPNRDDIVIPSLNKFNSKYGLSTRMVEFDLYGYKANLTTNKNKQTVIDYYSNSFIKDFSFVTEISPKLSTMLTVGATANSKVVGENSTAFSRFNAGLLDRYNTEVIQPKTIPGSGNDDKEIEDLVKNFNQNYFSYIDYLKRIAIGGDGSLGGGQYTKGEGTAYSDNLANYLRYLQQARDLIDKPDQMTVGTGFIPFNMSLTMDGLSGLKIYNKFNIDTRYLPSNYPEYAEFIIKNITHRIENSKWYTTLESIVISQGGRTNKRKKFKSGTVGSIPPCPTNLPVVPSGNPSDPAAKITWDKTNGYFSTTGIGGNSRTKNVELIIDSFKAAGVTNHYAILAVLAVAGKEQGYLPKDEYAYNSTGIPRLRKLFGGRLARFTDAEIKAKFLVPPLGTADNTNNKADIAFYDYIYGYLTIPYPAWTKHTNPGDGWKYRGRGFNGLTFKANYIKYGNKAEAGLGDRLVTNPELANDPAIAAKLLVAFFIDYKDKMNAFTNACEAIQWAVTRNHGGTTAMAEGYTNAYNFALRYKIE